MLREEYYEIKAKVEGGMNVREACGTETNRREYYRFKKAEERLGTQSRGVSSPDLKEHNNIVRTEGKLLCDHEPLGDVGILLSGTFPDWDEFSQGQKELLSRLYKAACNIDAATAGSVHMNAMKLVLELSNPDRFGGEGKKSRVSPSDYAKVIKKLSGPTEMKLLNKEARG